MTRRFKQVVAAVRAARANAVPVTDDSGLVLGVVCEHDLLAKTAGQGRSASRLARAWRHRERGKGAAVTAGA